ncbi:MAG: quinone-interacting membrane-bound oxidoreductase complex subunit QmoC [Dehalococcoidales bacterium]|nr:quinone-interacting membrane-bound oxidoreductase complex subunit QmoC [Dehalococcoidales bacterium]
MAVAEAPKRGTAEYVVPDKEFIKDVLALGGDSAKKCYQCGTCTTTCNVSFAKNGEEPFPRRLMLWTQWGLKDKVLTDASIWACHQCNDCSAYCPRGAKPGDVIAALRALAIERYSVPSGLAKFYREPKYLPLAFGLPFLILTFVLVLFGVTYPAGEIIYKHFIREIYVEAVGVIVAGLAVLAAALGLLRFWGELRVSGSGTSIPSQAVARPAVVDGPGSATAAASEESAEVTFARTMRDVALHNDFRACETDRLRTWGHMAALYGFPLLILATALSFIYGLFGIEQQHVSWIDPMKIAGNVGGLLALGGIALLMFLRFRAKKGQWGVATYFDWLLLAVIFANVFTGFLVQFSRLANLNPLAYQLYVFHLGLVLATFLYIPYGKFAHIFYRTAALAAIRQRGKTSPQRMFILLPAAAAVAVGAAAVAVGVLAILFWLLQAV